MKNFLTSKSYIWAGDVAQWYWICLACIGSWVRTVKRKGGGGERGGGSDSFWKLATGKNCASVFLWGRDKFSREAPLPSFSPMLGAVKWNRASSANLPSLLNATPQALLESTHKLLQIFEQSESELKIWPTNAVRNNRASYSSMTTGVPSYSEWEQIWLWWSAHKNCKC